MADIDLDNLADLAHRKHHGPEHREQNVNNDEMLTELLPPSSYQALDANRLVFT